jgi:hypothetical protein
MCVVVCVHITHTGRGELGVTGWGRFTRAGGGEEGSTPRAYNRIVFCSRILI